MRDLPVMGEVSHITRKPVWAVGYQARLKTAVSATETSSRVLRLHLWTTSLFASGINRFSQNMANTEFIIAALWKSGSYTGFTLSFRHSVITFQMKFEYLCGQFANLDQILSEASLWWGKGCTRFWDRLDQNSGFHGNRKRPLTYNGENDVATFSLLFFIRSFSNLQVTRTGIKSWRSSNFGQIGPLPTELGTLEHLKISHIYNGKMASPSYLVHFLSDFCQTCWEPGQV